MKKTNKLFPLCTHCTTNILYLHVYIFVSDLFIIPKRFFLFFIMVCFSIYVYCGLQKLYCFERNLFFVFSFVQKKYSFYIPNCIWNKYHVETQFAKIPKDKTRTHVKIPQQCNLCAVVCLVMIASEVAFPM